MFVRARSNSTAASTRLARVPSLFAKLVSPSWTANRHVHHALLHRPMPRGSGKRAAPLRVLRRAVQPQTMGQSRSDEQRLGSTLAFERRGLVRGRAGEERSLELVHSSSIHGQEQGRKFNRRPDPGPKKPRPFSRRSTRRWVKHGLPRLGAKVEQGQAPKPQGPEGNQPTELVPSPSTLAALTGVLAPPRPASGLQETCHKPDGDTVFAMAQSPFTDGPPRATIGPSVRRRMQQQPQAGKCKSRPNQQAARAPTPRMTADQREWARGLDPSAVNIHRRVAARMRLSVRAAQVPSVTTGVEGARRQAQSSESIIRRFICFCVLRVVSNLPRLCRPIMTVESTGEESPTFRPLRRAAAHTFACGQRGREQPSRPKADGA